MEYVTVCVCSMQVGMFGDMHWQWCFSFLCRHNPWAPDIVVVLKGTTPWGIACLGMPRSYSGLFCRPDPRTRPNRDHQTPVHWQWVTWHGAQLSVKWNTVKPSFRTPQSCVPSACAKLRQSLRIFGWNVMRSCLTDLATHLDGLSSKSDFDVSMI